MATAARAWLEYQAEAGLEGLPLGDAAGELPGARAATARRDARQQVAAAPAEPAAVTARPAPPAAAEPRAQAPAAGRPVAAALSPAERRQRLAELGERIRGCTRCPLHAQRTQTVFARGSAAAELVFVGEGPGEEEDVQGLPFVGPAGLLLDRMIAGMGLGRDEIYVCNIVKCRPPGNRKPTAAEMEKCLPLLREQLALVQPKVMVALGVTAAQGLLGTSVGITELRGKWRMFDGRIPVMPTFHPAYLLRLEPDRSRKRQVWEDLKQVMRRLGKTPPSPPRRERG
ncbi:MAG: uracil-DNA glycosylase [Deltaproteobacteria bacterium]|nr:uracil-DNA glycosylase [Deltaproteobacteria bacterium]